MDHPPPVDLVQPVAATLKRVVTPLSFLCVYEVFSGSTFIKEGHLEFLIKNLDLERTLGDTLSLEVNYENCRSE
jgi:hypothetical protein